MIAVKVNGSIEQALRVFKERVRRDGIFTELKRREQNIKPSIARRLKHSRALQRLRKLEKKREGWRAFKVLRKELIFRAVKTPTFFYESTFFSVDH